MNKEMENKQQNKKAGVWFLLILIVSGIFGGFIGGLATASGGIDGDLVSLTTKLGDIITGGIGVAAPYIMVVLFVLAFIYSATVFKKCKKRWDMEKDTNEDIYDELDSKLSNVLGVLQVFTVLSYFLFSANFYYAIYVKGSIWFLVALIVFIVDIVFVIGYQRKVVDFVKIMNPEKQGSVYDMKFQEKWMESCDEAEKLMIYQCAFKAYKVANGMCVFLWTLFTMLALFLKISLWPVAIVSLFWLVLTVSYLAESKKLEKKMSEK